MTDYEHPYNALPQGYPLAEYELVRVLGSGGFGITYLGKDNLGRAFAIKEYLPSDFATRTTNHSVVPQASNVRGDFQWGLDRFLDEAKTLARFDHRHLIKVHHFFKAHGTAYIVMEYAEGETLSAYLERQGTLSEAELKGILYPLLDGLAEVHKADILHRDIKPANIVIRKDGSPVLLDFGAARQAIGERSRPITSIVTPGYAPIEQYSSQGNQGFWTDIYALGGVCYQALTGQVPAVATDRVRHDPLIPVAECCSGRASQRFLSAIDAALSVYAEYRPQSVAAWREALEASVPVPARGQAQEERRREQALEQEREARLEQEKREFGRMVKEMVEEAKQKRLEKQRQAQEARPSISTETQKNAVDDEPIVGHVEQDAPPSESSKPPLFKWLVIALGVVAVLVGGKMYVDYAEQVALDKQRQEEQAALDKQRREQAALERQRQEGQAVLEKQRREQAALEKQRQERAVLEKLHQEEQAILNKAGVYNLHDAASKNAYEAAELLLGQGADVHAKDKNGNTPLHVAAWHGASSVAELLLGQRADVHAKNSSGWTPLYYAMEKNASETAAVLRHHGGRG